MIRQVWKYPLPPEAFERPVAVEMPRGARLVHVAVQRDVVCLWFEVLVREPRRTERFQVYGTGWDIDPYREHVGTGMSQSGTLVWHVYQATDDSEVHHT